MEYVVAFAILLAVSTVILIISMVLTSNFLGGVEFGPLSTVVWKSVVLLVITTGLFFVDYGVLLALVVWWIGMMFLFRLDFKETFVLIIINWGLNLLVRLFLLKLLLEL